MQIQFPLRGDISSSDGELLVVLLLESDISEISSCSAASVSAGSERGVGADGVSSGVGESGRASRALRRIGGDESSPRYHGADARRSPELPSETPAKRLSAEVESAGADTRR